MGINETNNFSSQQEILPMEEALADILGVECFTSKCSSRVRGILAGEFNALKSET